MVDLKEDIKNAFADNRHLILLSAAIFLVTLLAGYFLKQNLYDYLNPGVEQLKEGVGNGTIRVNFPTIFLNNVFIVLRLFIYGILFGLSILLLGYNGIFLGYFIAQSGSLVTTVLLIVPHGIFELPSIVIANASGLVLFKYAARVVRLKNSRSCEEGLIADDSITSRLVNSLVNNGDILKQSLILLSVAVALMAIAGFVEVYITKSLAFFIMNSFGLK